MTKLDNNEDLLEKIKHGQFTIRDGHVRTIPEHNENGSIFTNHGHDRRIFTRETVGYEKEYNFLNYEMLDFLKSIDYQKNNLCNNMDYKCVDGLIQTITALISIADTYFEIDLRRSTMQAGYFIQFSFESLYNNMKFINSSVTLNAFDIGKIFPDIISNKFVPKTIPNYKNNEELLLDDDFIIIEMIDPDYVEPIVELNAIYEINLRYMLWSSLNEVCEGCANRFQKEDDDELLLDSEFLILQESSAHHLRKNSKKVHLKIILFFFQS